MNTYKISLRVILLLLVTLTACNGYRFSTDITESDLNQHIATLASEEFQGRYPGTDGDIAAGRYISDRFSAMGYTVRQQEFTFLDAYVKGPDNYFELDGVDVPDSLFAVFSFSADSTVQAPVVFAGYGLSVDTDSLQWNDYNNLSVAGRWVMVLRGLPDIPGMDNAPAYIDDDRDKAMLASDNGAAGIILVSGDSYDPEDILNNSRGKTDPAGIPVIQVSRALANQLLQNDQLTVKDLEEKIALLQQPFGKELSGTIKAQTDIDKIMGATSNWIAMMEGSDPGLKDEYIVIGAHYDHLGMGGAGSSSRRPNTLAVHYGADDNASGVAAMLEIAGKTKGSEPFKRSLIFVAFGAEEMGLLGSGYFVEHTPVDITQLDAMINLDMVGRLDSMKGLQIGGTGTSVEADSIISAVSDTGLYKLTLSKEGSGPSDHSSFYGKDIPVFFLSTGAHTDYHTPDDNVESINFTGLKNVTEFTYQLIKKIDEPENRLSFLESGPTESQTVSHQFRVTLGFMPDFTSTDVEGVRIDFISKGKPAEKAGLKRGDIITAIDGMNIKNIYDYMYRLSRLKKNQIITVEINREGSKEVILVQL